MFEAKRGCRLQCITYRPHCKCSISNKPPNQASGRETNGNPILGPISTWARSWETRCLHYPESDYLISDYVTRRGTSLYFSTQTLHLCHLWRFGGPMDRQSLLAVRSGTVNPTAEHLQNLLSDLWEPHPNRTEGDPWPVGSGQGQVSPPGPAPFTYKPRIHSLKSSYGWHLLGLVSGYR